MIPFGNQRGLGQDLATHLMNEHDNEKMELAHLRGAIAKDLHGAFAEWELQADALTNCRNYLYSLSINPDPNQERLTRAQYLDYVARVEKALGLAEQPRAIVFHIKHDREHAHVVWSRIDAANGKAVHIAFDHEKLMRVTRQFARDHGIELPQGYFRDQADRDEKTKQLSLYEKHQQDATGLTKEERMELVADLWRQSDSARAFVQGLGQHGYMLASGKRPYVLVDIYGDTHSLPKLINDKRVRTKDVSAFLQGEYPPESLPSVDEAKKLAAQHRKTIDRFDKERAAQEQAATMEVRKAERRKQVLEKVRALKTRQLGEKRALESAQKKARMQLKARHLAEAKRIREARRMAAARGLAAFLGRVSGMSAVIRKLQRHRDRQRLERFRAQKRSLAQEQMVDMALLRERHRMQFLDLRRQVRAVDAVEKRETRSVVQSRLREARIEQRVRGDHQHMAPIDMARYEAARQKVRSGERDVDQLRAKASRRTLDQWRGGWMRLTDLFSRAAAGEKDDDREGRGSLGELRPDSADHVRRLRQKRRDGDRGPER